jgi:hypothetical protein
MPTYQLTLAHDVSVYGTVEIEATDLAAAVERVRHDLTVSGQPLWSDIYDVSWETSCGFRVVDVYLIDDNGMSEPPLVRNIAVSKRDDDTPLTTQQVLVALTTARLKQE